MLKLGKDGYIFISKNGNRYEILEGMTIGNDKRKTSDIIFIMYDPLDEPLELVSWLYGATAFREYNEIKEFEESITELVDQYEKQNRN